MVRNVVLINDFACVNGGAAQVCIQSAIILKKRGYNVIFFSATEKKELSLESEGITIIQTCQYDILSNPSRLSAIKQGLWNRKANLLLKEEILEKYNPEDTVIHIHGYIKALSPSIFWILSKYDFPIAVTLHDYFLACPNGGLFNYKKQKICELKPLSISCCCTNCDSRNYIQKIWRVIRQLVQRCTMFRIKRLWLISISNLTEEMLSLYPPISLKKIKFVRVDNPVELFDYHPLSNNANEYYLFMARLSPEKGIDLFCRAITELGLKGQVLGDGYERDYYEKKYPDILFRGWVKGEEKYKYILNSKALIFSSLWFEGLGLSVLEAQSLGLPCIVPDRCAASELIDDGVNGYIFQSGSLDSLKKTIIKMEQSDFNIVQANVKEKWRKKDFSLDTHCNKLVDVYEMMLRNDSFV